MLQRITFGRRRANSLAVMCKSVEFFAVLCAVAALPALVWSVSLQRSFNRALREAHPEVWAEFGTKGYFKYDESPKEAAAGWYLLTGQYCYLDDESLTRKGNRARHVTIAGFAVMCLGVLATSFPAYKSVFACLPPWS